MLRTHLRRLMDKAFLTKEEAEEAMAMIIEGADLFQVSAFLAMLKYRGESSSEIAGMAIALQKRAVPVNLFGPAVDIVGTGGDFANTVNISTGASILAAACGIPIAKHGNRSVSSRCGSADVLEAFGVGIEASPGEVVQSFCDVGIAFMFAPAYHPSLKKLASIRKSLGIPTIFNVLGPLLNPAKVPYALIGVASEAMLEPMSQAFLQMGYTKRALLFHGNGLDELSSLGKIAAYEICDDRIGRIHIDPVALGFVPCSLRDLQGGDALLNARLLKEAFSGHSGAIADALVLNAGAAVWIFGKADSLIDGISLARKVLRDGGALELLDRWVACSRHQIRRRNV